MNTDRHPTEESTRTEKLPWEAPTCSKLETSQTLSGALPETYEDFDCYLETTTS